MLIVATGFCILYRFTGLSFLKTFCRFFMNEILTQKEPLPQWRRVLLGLILAGMVTLASLLLVGYYIESQLGAEITMIKDAGEPVNFEDFQTDVNSAATIEDAGRYYDEALSQIDPNTSRNLMLIRNFYRKSIITLPADKFPGDMLKRIARILSQTQLLMEKFDEAAKLPLFYFDVGIEQGIEVYKVRVKALEAGAALLSIRTLEMIRTAREDAAVESVISMLKMSRIFEQCPTLLSQIAKAMFIETACQDIGLLFEHGCPSEQALSNLQDVLSQEAPEDMLERAFYAERVYQMEIGRNLIPEKIASELLQQDVPELPERLSLPSTRWGQLRLRQKATWYFRNMAELIETARRPWPEPFEGIVNNPPESMKKTDKLMASASMSVRLASEVTNLVRCAILVVAIERYRQSSGSVPASLEILVPGYLDSIPLDTFTGKKLLYRFDDKIYVVYSVGVNLKDDWGSVVSHVQGKSPEDFGFRIKLAKAK